MMQPDQWKVSARAPGEILTSAARDQGIELGLLGLPAGYTVEEIQGWLHDLNAVARETSGNDTESRTIPALLHHGLTGLLFSHEQLWNQEGQVQPASYAFVESDGWVGFGWIGPVDVQVWVDGEVVQPEAIIVRDDMGREARAFVANHAHALVVRLSWPAGSQEGSAASIVAEWAGTSQAAAGEATQSQQQPTPPVLESPPVQPDAAVAQAAALPDPVVAPPTPPADAGPAGGWFGDSASPVEIPALPHSESEPIPTEPPTMPVATAEQEFTHSNEPRDIAVAAMDAPAEVDPTIESDSYAPTDDATTQRKGSGLRRMFARLAFWKRSEAEDVEVDAQSAADSAVHLDEADIPFDDEYEDIPGVPDQIPPTPEPAELTERAVGLAPGIPADALSTEAVAPTEPAPVAPLPDSPFVEIAAAVTQSEGDAPTPPATAALESETAFEDAQPLEPVASVDAAAPVVPEAPTPFELPSLPEPASVVQPFEDPAGAGLPAPGEQLEAKALVEADITGGRVPMRPAWPSADELARPTPIWKRPIAWAAVIAALFAGGWLAGNLQNNDSNPAAGGVQGVLRGLGLGGAHFEVMVNSRPSGAWIAIDGEDIAQRTPASVDIPPGDHEITLSFSDHGSATYEVRGVDGDELSVDAVLWGSVNVYSSDSAVPVAVTVDGKPRGFAPMSVDSLAPGTHELRFSGPGLPSWGQTVQVRVQEEAEVVARPMTSPATGLIEVRTTLATPTGADPLEGAQVWVDGRPQGVTPLSLELPRGPHSLRVTLGDESSPVQVIDLPGGNQRFAHFQLGLDSGAPRLQTIDPPAAVALDRSSVIAVALDQLGVTDVKEVWLHVQTTNATWRRYEMAIMKAPDGIVAVTVFPNTQFDDKGLVRFYASARTHVGDEYYTEIQRAKAAGR